jgi:hypothetical protein
MNKYCSFLKGSQRSSEIVHKDLKTLEKPCNVQSLPSQSVETIVECYASRKSAHLSALFVDR